MPLGLGRVAAAWRGNGGTVFTIGPTQDILLTPSSLSLATVGATATLVPIAVDGNGTPTGQRVYLYSTDPAHVTVNPDTYVVTRVAMGGSALIQGKLVAPVGVPAFTNAPNQTLILGTDLSEAHYASATVAGQYPYAGGGDPAGPLRWAPFYSPANPAGGPYPVDTDKEEIVTDSFGKWLRLKYAGVDQESANWMMTPPLPMTEVRTIGVSYTARWTITSGLPDVKNIQAMWSALNPEDNGHLQVSLAPSTGGDDKQYLVHDQVFTESLVDLMSPIGNGLADIADGLGHPTTLYFRSHARSAGTVDRLVQEINHDPSLHPTFNVSQDGSAITNGCRILIFWRDNVGELHQGSDAEFIVSNFDGGQLATLTRATDITGSTVPYSGGIFFLADVKYTGTFSVSQAGHLTNGDMLAMNTAQDMVPCTVAAFDGAYTCELPQYNTAEVNKPIQDRYGLWFSRPSDQTGFVKYYTDGIKLIDISAATVDAIPAGASRPWCTRAALASLAVGSSVARINLGNVALGTRGPWTHDVGVYITVWSEP